MFELVQPFVLFHCVVCLYLLVNIKIDPLFYVFLLCHLHLILASSSCFCVGEGFLEGMLLDGWLLNLVRICGFVEDSVASWTLTNCKYLFLYSV